ncbi:MAG: tetraacyldisaccharide 4'-kinase [Flammeovirgaceae bacterium]|nr:tetraacyldisaccharide 4'-kinase [Flammeovirgaceae bacterium]
MKYLLLPFAGLYNLITRLRNYLYDIGHKKSFQFDTIVISVGNLNVGGSGKTPMVEYLIRLLSSQYKVATLSRGYGRKTKGFVSQMIMTRLIPWGMNATRCIESLRIRLWLRLEKIGSWLFPLC